jgi:hypothetical protein
MWASRRSRGRSAQAREVSEKVGGVWQEKGDRNIANGCHLQDRSNVLLWREQTSPPAPLPVGEEVWGDFLRGEERMPMEGRPVAGRRGCRGGNGRRSGDEGMSGEEEARAAGDTGDGRG